MKTSAKLESNLMRFYGQFHQMISRYDGTARGSSELEAVIDEYSAFVTRAGNSDLWEEMKLLSPRIVEELRRKSALCVAIMEKVRAMKLLNGITDRTDYFGNIESCIEREFGSFRVDSDSKVVLVGSGSYPMTPLYLAKQTGAEVVGIDIDPEAIELGRLVVSRLGSGLNIRLEHESLENLEAARHATHIIFSSTIEQKYELLDRIHPLTGRHVIVAMRYGNGIKSLFNFPMEEVDPQKWRLAETVLQPERVFDVALYRKA